MNFSKLTFGASMLALGVAYAGSATAQATDDKMMANYPDRGFYISGNIGGHETMDSEVDGAGIDSTVETDRGIAGLVGLGYDFGDNLRIELEGGYRGAGDVSSVSGVTGTGDVDAYSGIANVFYDFNVGGGIEPYIGGGLGMARVSLDGVGPFGGRSINDDDWGLAVQAGAGLAIPLNNRLKFTADYRFMSVRGLEYTTSGGTNVDAEYDDHAVFIGLRFALNPPAPAPQPVAQAAPAPAPVAPPPAPAPVRDFLVFFDFDSDVITPQAEAILREAAANAKLLGNSRITATGHADRSGSASYNMGLSQRRADAVRAALVRLGLQTNEIQTVARGETDPLVATPDGVREPQNRRVQIVL